LIHVLCMPNFKAHCAISQQRTGFDFADLHKWMDNPPEAKIIGPSHSILRHAFTESDMNYIKDYWEGKKGSGWGDKAVIEWLFHIAIDNIHTAFKLSKTHYGANTYNLLGIGLNSNGYVSVDFDRVSDHELRDIFE
jgi:hypothetical protein